MFNPSALGLALLALLATTTMVGSSAGSHQPFQAAHRSLSGLLANHGTDQIMGAYQRQVNTISLSRSALGERHQLTITAPAGGSLQGTLTINNQSRQALGAGATVLDLSPYLTQPLTTVVIAGTYNPSGGAVVITFEGPNTTVQQQARGTGRVNYQLNLVVD